MNSEQKVKQRPILFSTPMVQAILEGRKTVTRRIINPQPILSADNCPDRARLVNVLSGTDNSLFYFWKSFPLPNFPDSTEHLLKYCPYGKIGDILWVRESFNLYANVGDCGVGCEYGCKHGKYVYKAMGNWDDEAKWKPSIHMPFDACRLFLKITDIRVERLQDISEDDAKAEGVIENRDGSWHDYLEPKRLCQDDARASFISLWESINGPNSWQENPWLWVVSFKRIDKSC